MFEACQPAGRLCIVMDTMIPIADLQPIHAVAEVDRALEDGAAQRNEGVRIRYDRMPDRGGSRCIVKPSTAAAVDALYDASPNFADVVDDQRKFLVLAVAGCEAVQFTPMLLLGEPGPGRTCSMRSERRSSPDAISCFPRASIRASCAGAAPPGV